MMSGEKRYVYIVTGTTGEYSDRSEWLVAAYYTEGLAKKHVMDAEKWYLMNGGDNMCDLFEGELPENPFDPDMYISYTGASWFIQKAELKE